LPSFLKYILTDPTHHRWHHTSEREAAHKNYAALFAFYDVLFGTYFYPKDKVPTEFGLKAKIPQQFVALMLWPIKRWR
jgi:sterol desaturase/sphingolipid hydroxylase (fatty acid hydroxylase superfamily)